MSMKEFAFVEPTIEESKAALDAYENGEPIPAFAGIKDICRATIEAVSAGADITLDIKPGYGVIGKVCDELRAAGKKMSLMLAPYACEFEVSGEAVFNVIANACAEVGDGGVVIIEDINMATEPIASSIKQIVETRKLCDGTPLPANVTFIVTNMGEPTKPSLRELLAA